jgi:hypothetical protein
MLPLPSENITDKEFLKFACYMLNSQDSLPRDWQLSMAVRLEKLVNPDSDTEVVFKYAPVQLELPFVNS